MQHCQFDFFYVTIFGDDEKRNISRDNQGCTRLSLECIRIIIKLAPRLICSISCDVFLSDVCLSPSLFNFCKGLLLLSEYFLLWGRSTVSRVFRGGEGPR